MHSTRTYGAEALETTCSRGRAAQWGMGGQRGTVGMVCPW